MSALTDIPPLSFVVGPANEHDSTRFVDTVECINMQSGARQRTRPVAVYADKTYDSSPSQVSCVTQNKI